MSYNYYSFRSEKFTCPNCAWSGIGSETFLSDLSEMHTHRDIKCPKCEQVLFTFDLDEVAAQQEKLGNPGPKEQVCFNCTHFMWMVGIGLGLKCRLTRNKIENRGHTCEKFEFKQI
jgi:phage FluMu protein Com